MRLGVKTSLNPNVGEGRPDDLHDLVVAVNDPELVGLPAEEGAVVPRLNHCLLFCLTLSLTQSNTMAKVYKLSFIKSKIRNW